MCLPTTGTVSTMDPASFVCSVCAHHHDELPHISSEFPDACAGVPEAERAARVVWTPDTCEIDDDRFFVRAILDVAVADHPEPLGFNLWVAVHREDFATYLESFESADLAPVRATLATELTCYPLSALGLATTVVFRGGGQRPRVTLDPTDHPLAVDQRTGIPLSKACQLIHHFD
ncbi:MAG: hypothetical protein JWP01_3464 [Myxococcales bacterium]|nr:hypothetical protein [Myxococcales bacterium]